MAGEIGMAVQGLVLVECVVDVNGLCRGIEVARSLDSTFGLSGTHARSIVVNLGCESETIDVRP